MAADDYDETTGAPIFAGTGAPDTGVDLTLISAFAAEVGTRLIGTTAERTAYDYAREGLEWYDTDEDAVYRHTGAGWKLAFKDWTSYTPVLTNVAGTVKAAYQIVGETVNVRLRVNPISSMGSNPTFSLPVAAGDSDLEFPNGAVMMYDDSAGVSYSGIIRRAASATTVTIYGVLASGTYTSLGGVSASSPFTWASADILTVNFSYRTS